MKKVAIYQNTISRGGRIRVIAYMTECLNELGIVPDWISFRNGFDNSDLESMHSVPINANFKIIDSFNKGLGEYKYIKLNKIMDQMSPNYDLVINSNNSLSGIKQGQNFLHFIYFPREARVISDFNNSVYNKIPNWFFRIMYSNYSTPNKKNPLIAISAFTKKAISIAYNIPHNNIDLIYPPVPLDSMNNSDEFNKENSIISIGRFDPNKNQISQIKIAQNIPSLLFYVCGFTPNKQSEKYFESCKALIEKNNISNVKLVRNAESRELDKLLKLSKFFIHTMHDEPFGLGTVEAIMHGCLPIVHNSGGSAEIVGKKQLLFNDSNDAILKITELKNLAAEDINLILENLNERIKQFDESIFKSVFTLKLKQLLN